MAPSPTAHRTDWFHHARWGASSHYLVAPELSAADWNRHVDSFDVTGLARALASAGVGYYWLTIGQNSGHYCSPNATYDGLVGRRPSLCSRRDLIADLAAALASHGVRAMAYLPSGAPAQDAVAQAALEWEWGFEGGWPHGWEKRTGKRLGNFQRKWQAVIREWSVRWGTNIHGWWFDGCYFADEMYRHPDAPNFASFAAAARAGNPDAIVAFNPGIMLQTMGPEEDYTAGETNEPDKIAVPPGRWLDGEQVHIWSYLGRSWMQPPLRFTDEQAAACTRRNTATGAVMTWDIPLQEDGVPALAVTHQLAAIGRALDTRQALDRTQAEGE